MRSKGNGRALSIYVFRNPVLGDSTNGGPSAFADQILVIGDTVEGYIDPAQTSGPYADRPLFRLVRGAGPGIARLVPVAYEGRWTMFGGNYGACSDSRFSAAIEGITGNPFYGAVPIHDRVEG